MPRCRFLPLILCLFWVPYSAADEQPAQGKPAPGKIDFARHIQPILQQHCVKCHGGKKQESGLRLDSGSALLRGGDHGLAVKSGDISQSRLLIAIGGGTDEISRMPPEGPLLSSESVVLIKAVKLYLAKRLDVYWGVVKQV